jgi:HK97 family phage major capsid protein
MDFQGFYDEIKSALNDAKSDIGRKYGQCVKRIDEWEALMRRPDFTTWRNPSGRETKDLASMLFEHDEFRDFARRGARGRIRIPFEETPLELKTVITSAAVGSSTPGILVPERIPGIVKPGVPRIRVADLIPHYPIVNNSVEVVKENVFTSNASPQSEASDKLESALTFTIDSEAVRTIAHWIPASRQVLDDLPGLQMFVRGRLVDGLLDELDDQILRGDGTTGLSGLTNEATAYSDATYDQTGDTKLDKLARMLTQLEDSNMSGSGFILHPRQWREIQTIKADQGGGAGTGAYVLGGPQGNVPAMAWGLPVATTTRNTYGQAFVGAFASHVILALRQGVTVDISTEHSDYFVKNLVAIRAELRCALLTLRSDAVIYESSL